MKWISGSGVALAAFALLSACGPKGGGAGKAAGGSPAGETAASSAPTSGPDVAIDMSNMPHQRAGLWKTHSDDGEGKPQDSTSCVSGKAPAVPKMPAGCSKFSIKRTFLGAYVMDMNCKTPDMSMVAHAVGTGDFQTHMIGDSTMTMSGRNLPARTIKVHTEATWLGPCAPGQKPDDEE